MIREIMKKIKEKKKEKLEQQSTPEIHVGMSVCVERRDPRTYLSRAEIGVIVAADVHKYRQTFLVKFKDGSVDSYDADAIFTDYDKELLK